MTRRRILLSILLLFLCSCVYGLNLYQKEQLRYDALLLDLHSLTFAEDDLWSLSRIRYNGTDHVLEEAQTQLFIQQLHSLTSDHIHSYSNIYAGSPGCEYTMLRWNGKEETTYHFEYTPAVPTRIVLYPSSPSQVEAYNLVGNRHDMIYSPDLINLMLDLIPYEREGSTLTAARHLPGEKAHKTFTDGITDFLRILTTAEDRTSFFGKMPDTYGKTPDSDLYYSFEIITEGEADRYEATYYLYEGKNGWHLDSAAGGAYTLSAAAAGQILDLFDLSTQ